MKGIYDPITVGRVTLPYLYKRRGWITPDNRIETNAFKAQLIAEKENERLKLLAASLGLCA
ncbi:DUF1317 family protein [Cedecea neteri]|uniref:DUF1317 family protein n=1 Tax=Cedecea neteri TaxID=158822 RepID=UPI002892A608|nr:DUF1317 family protein [Cedecea neteri]WNJ77800.1 DUF1317 family protein [Cedecea neteri]